MTVLAYCITEGEAEVKVPTPGLEDRAIRSLEESGLRCFISDYGNEASGKSVRESALAFSRVLQQIFAQAAIIPFCFPTLLASESEISAFLRVHAAEYRKALSRLRHSVQMDLYISFRDSTQKFESGDESGTEYLRRRLSRHQRLEALSEEFRRVGQGFIEDWHQREVATGMRGYALIARRFLASFLEKMAQVPIPADLQARITGPWPAAEFLKER
jgi:Gas vesicle synthesis protein GvpL/GvpF